MANSVDRDETAHYEPFGSLQAVSSGSALFAKVFVLVCRDEWVTKTKCVLSVIYQLCHNVRKCTFGHVLSAKFRSLIQTD